MLIEQQPLAQCSEHDEHRSWEPPRFYSIAHQELNNKKERKGVKAWEWIGWVGELEVKH